jgi:hypothetical protein
MQLGTRVDDGVLPVEPGSATEVAVLVGDTSESYVLDGRGAGRGGDGEL